MSQNPFVGLILFMVMGLFTLWFTSLMLKAIDILYKPSVKKWIKNSGGQKVINIHAGNCYKFISFAIKNWGKLHEVYEFLSIFLDTPNYFVLTKKNIGSIIVIVHHCMQ